MSVYRSSYTITLDLHNQMVRAMKALKSKNASQYIANAIRNENKKHLDVTVEEFLQTCSDEDIEQLKEEIKKRGC